jgi:hypothetical protein
LTLPTRVTCNISLPCATFIFATMFITSSKYFRHYSFIFQLMPVRHLFLLDLMSAENVWPVSQTAISVAISDPQFVRRFHMTLCSRSKYFTLSFSLFVIYWKPSVSM